MADYEIVSYIMGAVVLGILLLFIVGMVIIYKVTKKHVKNHPAMQKLKEEAIKEYNRQQKQK